MRRERVRDLLGKVADGSVPVDSALASLAQEPMESLGFATIDHHRALRQGFPEVVYGAGKTTEQLVAITQRIAERGDGVLATRVADESAPALLAALPGAEHNALARTVVLRATQRPTTARGTLLVVTAGTSDLPVAEEAAGTADAMGCVAERLTRVQLPGFEDRSPSGLSGGQKRRIGIARATVTRPPIVLCDEPAAGLDPVTSLRIFELLRAEQRAANSTVVLVSSDVDRLLTVTDRVGMMHEGRLVFDGTTAEARESTNPLIRQFLRGALTGPL